MTVYCLIPVHNRLDCTKVVLRCLKDQDFRDVRIVVVDDGSSDGTADHIRQHPPDVELIPGDGSLWWSGAMAKGLAAILPRAKEGDFVLFLNSDAHFTSDYIRTLVNVSQAHSRVVVGSIVMDAEHPEQILSIGPRIRYGRVLIEEVYSSNDTETMSDSVAVLPEVIEMDALSGRGTLYPVEILQRIGTIRSRWLPHYLADYEIAVRARRAGIPTLVSTRAKVWTDPGPSGIRPGTAGLLQLVSNRRSRSNILDKIAFFTLCGPWYLRVTAPLRIMLFCGWRWLKGYKRYTATLPQEKSAD